jgi:hypothetical protein
MIVVPGHTDDGQNALYVGFSEEDLDRLGEDAQHAGVINVADLEMPTPTEGVWHIIFFSAETDEQCKDHIQARATARTRQ